MTNVKVQENMMSTSSCSPKKKRKVTGVVNIRSSLASLALLEVRLRPVFEKYKPQPGFIRP